MSKSKRERERERERERDTHTLTHTHLHTHTCTCTTTIQKSSTRKLKNTKKYRKKALYTKRFLTLQGLKKLCVGRAKTSS